jgi:hypothetical protein
MRGIYRCAICPWIASSRRLPTGDECGLRDYGHSDQIGLEATPAAYVGHLVDVFAEVRRVLKYRLLRFLRNVRIYLQEAIEFAFRNPVATGWGFHVRDAARVNPRADRGGRVAETTRNSFCAD